MLPPLRGGKSSEGFYKKPNDKYLFDIKEYRIIRNISKGGFGIVNLVQNKKSGNKYAAKTNLIQTENQSKLFVSREVRILIKIQHPTIIQFRGFSYQDFDGNQNVTILMDFMNEGSLAELIEKEQRGLCPSNYDDTKRQIILVGIARGMMTLHKNHIIHRDLKPENILLDGDFNPRITDFGLSKFFDPNNSMKQSMTDTGTAPYMAPEVIEGDRYNTKADVYSFGILMYEVVTGKRAYYDLLHGKKKINSFQLQNRVFNGLRPAIEEGDMKKGIQLMIEKCWSSDPKQRPTFRELFNKLSLSDTDDVLEFEENNQNQIIDEKEEIESEDDEIRLKKFCLENVDCSELFDYIDKIIIEPTTFDQQQQQQKQQQEQKVPNEEFTKMAEQINDMRNQMSMMNRIINDQQKEIAALKSTLESSSSSLSTELKNKIESIEKKFGPLIACNISNTEPGILQQLKNREKSYFDPIFIASMSTRDIYDLIDPNSEHLFATGTRDNFTIEFEFKENISINGIQIFTSASCFPRSFDIKVDDTVVKSIKDAVELNGVHKSMTVNFDPINAKKISFTLTGQNWDKESSVVYIKRIEVLSNEDRFNNGVFKTFVSQSENNDPHRCPVHISASNFDFNSFYNIDSKNSITSGGKNNEYLQIEFVRNWVILNGCRIKRVTQNGLKSFMIVCTDDVKKPLDAWIKLLEINENSIDEHQAIQTYEFEKSSPLVKFVRLIQTGPNWGNKLNLKLRHFDLFGCCF